MPKADLSVNAEATRNLRRPAIKVDNGKTGDGITPRPISSSRTRHLDVDAVLARSLPKVVTE
jgi:hypothetical protein